MLVTIAALEALRTSFNASFKKGSAKAKPKLGMLATRTTTTTGSGTYGFLGDLPGFRKWAGDKRVKSLEEKAYQLINEPYEATLGIHKHKIQDDALGMYPAIFEGWGQEAEMWPDRLLTDALKLGHTLPCFDNQNFFDSSHPQFDEAGSTYSNMSAAGPSQPWYLVDLSKALAPLMFQEREKPHFWMITDPNDSKVADTGRFGCYGEARGAAGYTLPYLAYRSTQTLNIANFVAARDAMASYVDDIGDPRGIVPTHIVFGVSNRSAAEEIFKKMNLAGGESNVHWNECELLFAERLP